VREIGRGLEMPPSAALDEVDPARLVVCAEPSERLAHVGNGGIAEVARERFGGQRLPGGEQRRLYGAIKPIRIVNFGRHCETPKAARQSIVRRWIASLRSRWRGE
jgi:hypothetical protein